MLALLTIAVAIAAALLLSLGVLPGYRGTFEIHIDYASGSIVYSELSVKQMQIRETVDRLDSSGTATPRTSTRYVLQETSIPGKARCRINVSAQWSADGAGDPPDFSGEKLYGYHAVRATAGNQIIGFFGAEEAGNMLSDNGTIDYDLGLVSVGQYSRT